MLDGMVPLRLQCRGLLRLAQTTTEITWLLTDDQPRIHIWISLHDHPHNRDRFIFLILQRKDHLIFWIVEAHARLEGIVEVIVESAYRSDDGDAWYSCL